MSTTRWTTMCHGCGREREVESRSSHAMKVLCDDCAARTHRPPSASGLQDPETQPTTHTAPDRAAWVSGVLGLGMDPIVDVMRESAHLDAPINVRLRSGRVLRWERQRDLM